jgi:hypothetical protein
LNAAFAAARLTVVLLALLPRDRHPGLPPAADVHRFPGRWVCTENRRFAAQYLNHLDDRLRNEPHLEYELARLAENARWHWACWNALEDGWLLSNEEASRTALALVKQLVGDENYRLGVMPPPVPLWAFQEVTADYVPPKMAENPETPP